MEYKISIIIPVFNVENYIEDALESIIRQSIGLENLEIIMVDDCSTDQSGRIMDEYADKNDNFVAIHLSKNSGGAGKPRNVGIERSTGQYLMFLDPDDSYADDACSTLYQKISEENVDMVFGTFSVNDKSRDRKLKYSEIKIDTIDEHKTFLKGSPTLWTRIYRRRFIKENNIRFPLIKAAQDAVFVTHTLLKAKGIIYINKVITYYTDLRDESVTNKKDIKTLYARIEAYNQIYDLCKESGKEEYFTSFILRDKLVNWMKHFIFSDLSALEKRKALELSGPLFRKCKEYGLTFPSGLDYVVDCTINEKFEDAIFFLTEIREEQFKGKKPLTPKDINFTTPKSLKKFKKEQFEYKPRITGHEYKEVTEQYEYKGNVTGQKGSIEASIDEIDYLINKNEIKFNALNREINMLTAQFYRMEYQNGRSRTLSQRLISKFPSLYILFKRNKGLKDSLINIKGYKAIKKYNLLDIGYYLKNNEDIRLSGTDPILHYIYHGYKEGRKPNPTFDANYYLENNYDVRNSNLNPLIHYALYGKKEGRTTGINQGMISGVTKGRIFETNEVRKPNRENKHYDITIKVPSPNWNVAHNWGDYHLASALKTEFEKNGYETDLQMYSEWEEVENANVVLVLRGKFEYDPKPENFNIMWNISHPDEISEEEYNKYDYVLIASDKWADELRGKLNVPVESLLQCTDPGIFYPDYSAEYEHDLLFVGNSRKVFRKILRDLLPTSHDLAIYGKGWGFLDKKLIKGDYIPNDQLRKAYSTCKILLNDHWDDMSEKGFISNRIFDGFAAGAFIISDEINGASEIFEDSLITYSNPQQINQLIEYYLENNEERKELAEKGRNIVLTRHTFQKRVNSILEIITDDKINK